MPIVLDISKFHVQELNRQYIQQVIHNGDRTSIDLAAYMNVSLDSDDNDDDFIVLGKIHHGGSLNYFKFRDQESITIEAAGFTHCLDCVEFERRFCVVDNSGKTFCVEPSSGTSFMVAKALEHNGGFKILIQLCENLLLAEMICVATPTPSFRFEVFQLDGERKRWDRLESLGDGILFFGEYCKFSVPAIPGVKGNCLVFTQVTGGAVKDENGRPVAEALVFDLSSRRTLPLDHRPDLLQLFRPPSFL